MEQKIIFLVKAGRIFRISYGHLFRSIQIYEKLKKKEVIFLINKDKKSEEILKSKKINFKTISKFNQKNLLDKIKRIRPKKIFLDTYDFADNNFTNSLKKLNIKVILIDDFPQKKISADVIYNYSIIKKLKKKYFNYDKIFFGPKYLIPFNKKKVFKKKEVLISLGGSDIKNYSEKIVDIILQIKTIHKVRLILGPGNMKKKYQRMKKKYNKSCEINYNVKNLEKEISKSSIFITSAGYTMYKAMYLNKICIVIPTSPHEKKISKIVKKMKLALVCDAKLKFFKKLFFQAVNSNFKRNILKNIKINFNNNSFKDFLKNV